MIVTAEMIRSEAVENKDLWETPQHIIDKLYKVFHFDLDPCCTKETRKCSYYFTPKENGLIQDWSFCHAAYVNPPYSRYNIDKWVAKCVRESKHTTVVALLPVSTSSDWFKNYVIGNTLYWVDKRIRFVNAPYTAPFSSVIVHFNGININKTFKQR